MNIISGLRTEHYHDSLSFHITVKVVSYQSKKGSFHFITADERALKNHSTLIISRRTGRLHRAYPGLLPAPDCDIATCPTWAIGMTGLPPVGLQLFRLLPLALALVYRHYFIETIATAQRATTATIAAFRNRFMAWFFFQFVICNFHIKITTHEINNIISAHLFYDYMWLHPDSPV